MIGIHYNLQHANDKTRFTLLLTIRWDRLKFRKHIMDYLPEEYWDKKNEKFKIKYKQNNLFIKNIPADLINNYLKIIKFKINEYYIKKHELNEKITYNDMKNFVQEIINNNKIFKTGKVMIELEKTEPLDNDFTYQEEENLYLNFDSYTISNLKEKFPNHSLSAIENKAKELREKFIFKFQCDLCKEFKYKEELPHFKSLTNSGERICKNCIEIKLQRECEQCHKLLPITDFYPIVSAKEKYSLTCKKCTANYTNKYNEKLRDIDRITKFIDVKQYPNEKDPAFKYFKLYISLGNNRTIEMVSERAGIDLNVLRRYKQKYDWDKRIKDAKTDLNNIDFNREMDRSSNKSKIDNFEDNINKLYDLIKTTTKPLLDYYLIIEKKFDSQNDKLDSIALNIATIMKSWNME